MTRQLHDADRYLGENLRSLNEGLDAQPANYAIPVREATKTKLFASIDKVNRAIEPTINELANERTQVELIQRIKHKIGFHVEKFDACLRQSMDYHDSSICHAEMDHYLDNQIMRDARDILKEY